MNKVEEIKIKGQGKYPLKYCRWTNIAKAVAEEGSNKSNRATTVSFSREAPLDTGQKETPVKIELVETDDQFLVGKPEKEELIVIKKPTKTEIYLLMPEKLVDKIAYQLNKIPWTKMLSSWSPTEDHRVISALGKMEKVEIEEKIIPVIEKIIKEFCGDEK